MLRPLPRDAGPQLDPLTAPLVKAFPDGTAFFAWQVGLEAAIASGQVTGLARYAGDDLEAVMLIQEQGGLATILVGLGACTDAFLEACLDDLQGRLDALIWDEWVGADWPARLAHRGIRAYELETRVQELARTPVEAPDPALAIRPWRPEDAADVIPLLATANATTLAGLFLTYPIAPTPAAYAATMQAILAGEKGDFLPEASHVAYLDGRLAGVLLSVRQDAETSILFELATHPWARGKQVGRSLVRAKQQSLRELGIPRLAFITTPDNLPIHRFYREEEIVERSATRGAYWLRGT
ncbi:MAG: Acetyltransferase family [Cyanobacteria bacterium RYN_339]|nr:Acetyltransferase family [Cyanobacteria bacterium RYN_339]